MTQNETNLFINWNNFKFTRISITINKPNNTSIKLRARRLHQHQYFNSWLRFLKVPKLIKKNDFQSSWGEGSNIRFLKR